MHDSLEAACGTGPAGIPQPLDMGAAKGDKINSGTACRLFLILYVMNEFLGSITA
ncbi:hypothetical protein [uncultured Alistipes sp.]|uniref:hypothetical protein n=1 Tax=uncultured Alistipes sp. TaxID=538949 RepID=UPI00260964FB|nr:hypothetical protein [uncultured Alistipes sp.]